jgi:sugar phosphate isomerase/epimerase
VADSHGLPSAERERLPPGYGSLRLETLVMSLIEHGYTGDFEFELVGEKVESLGYDQVLGQARLAADAWSRRIPATAT